MSDSLKGSEYPSLMGIGSMDDEDLDKFTIQHAKYFTVIRMQPGGFVGGKGSNYIREEVPTIEEARIRAEQIYQEAKRPILIYAVADFAGAIGFSRPVEQFPIVTYRSKSDQLRDKKKASAARTAARKAKKEAAVFSLDFPIKR